MITLIKRILSLLFPERCTLCHKILTEDVTVLCRSCAVNAPYFPAKAFTPNSSRKRPYPFLDSFTAVWYYEGDVRRSLLRYKFHHSSFLAPKYAQLLTSQIQKQDVSFDCITWVPVSRLRKMTRGYDQSQLLAESVAKELGMEAVPLLVKIRNTRKQSTIRTHEARNANVLGAYRPINPEQIRGKSILLIDDILTTGSTAGECAKTLLTAGAKQIHCAAVAAARHRQNKPRR